MIFMCAVRVGAECDGAQVVRWGRDSRGGQVSRGVLDSRACVSYLHTEDHAEFYMYFFRHGGIERIFT